MAVAKRRRINKKKTTRSISTKTIIMGVVLLILMSIILISILIIKKRLTINFPVGESVTNSDRDLYRKHEKNIHKGSTESAPEYPKHDRDYLDKIINN